MSELTRRRRLKFLFVGLALVEAVMLVTCVHQERIASSDYYGLDEERIEMYGGEDADSRPLSRRDQECERLEQQAARTLDMNTDPSNEIIP